MKRLDGGREEKRGKLNGKRGRRGDEKGRER